MQKRNKNSDFRKYLQDELERRAQLTRGYSMRAFARYLEADSSFLSKILSGKRAVTLRTIYTFGARLNLQPADIERFIDGYYEIRAQRRLDRFVGRMQAEDKRKSALALAANEKHLHEFKERVKSEKPQVEA